MSEYLTGVQDFSVDNYYVGQPGTLVGSSSFAAAALLSLRREAGVQTVWANRDGANNGWEISSPNPGTGAIAVEIMTTAGLVSITATPDTNWWYIPTLVILFLSPSALALFINGSQVANAPMAGKTFLPAVGTAPTVGVRIAGGPPNAADATVVHGVAYTDPAPAIGAGAGPHYLACRQAKDLVGFDDLNPADDFTNRWSAKHHNYQPGPVGVATWLPDVGALNLTRVGIGAPSIRGFKDLDWHYSFDSVQTVNP